MDSTFKPPTARQSDWCANNADRAHEGGAATSSLYRSLVVRALSPMSLGCLKMRLPDGREISFGTPGTGIEASIRLNSENFFRRCVWFGDVGFAESYLAGEWETDDLTRVIEWFILNVEQSPAMSGSRRRGAPVNWLRRLNQVPSLLQWNPLKFSRRNIARHYDLGNDFFQLWLDPTLTYSSALFTSPDLSLQEAQIAKYDALCKKLRLKPSDHLLEIGSGWGGFAAHAVRTYGCRVTTITISEEQFKFAGERFQKEGLGDRARVEFRDFRNIQGSYDKIVSIEMLEAVGEKFIDAYFAKCHAALHRNGLLALQFITCPDQRYRNLRKGVDFIQKHIFPGSLLLSLGRVSTALQRTGDLSMFQLDDMGLDYARTLKLWRESFVDQVEAVRGLGFDETFIRKWVYYLSYCEAAFAMRNISVVQAVYSRPNNASLIR
jgi:cyclopropane-fatty-acyl-phospholipid synthase